ncbi:MAG TPA: hypothetical protein DDZ41_02725 [Flavobacterium sp.]|nr:hypothetical protein [Flavobacterium sp.]
MKTLILSANLFVALIVSFILFPTTSSVAQTTTDPNFDTNTLYPSPDIVIPYHTEWTKTHYIERIAEFKANPLQFNDIVFVGNSITEQGGDWGVRFNNLRVKNRGIAGDVTAGVINRLAEIYYYKPEKVFLEIGINDLFRGDLTSEYVANNIKSIIEKIHLESPTTKIYIQTVFPTSNDTSLKAKIIATNTLLKAFTPSDYFQIIDTYTLFANANDLMTNSYTTDGVHLNQSGYTLWQNYVKDIVNAPVLSIEQLNIDQQYVLYPNPVDSILNIKNTTGLNTGMLKIINTAGKTVHFEEITEEKNTINVENLKSGIYVLTITSSNSIKNFKFIKK